LPNNRRPALVAATTRRTAEGEDLAGMRRGGPEHAGEVRIAADHAIERYDVGAWYAFSQGGKISSTKRNTPAVIEPCGLVARSREVCFRGVDVSRMGELSFQQGMVNGTDPSTDVEQRRGGWESPGLYRRDELPGRRIGTTAPIAPEIPTGYAGIKRLRGVAAVTAGHRALPWVDP
jgi:hypothetical protein